MRRLWLLLLAVCLFVITVACSSKDDEKAQKEEGNSEEMTELPEPDLTDIPEVVLEVNGEKVNKAEFESIYIQRYQREAQQAQAEGATVEEKRLKQAVAEDMANQKLIMNEANEKIEKANEDDVNKLLEDLVEQAGLDSKEELFSFFEEQDMSEKEVMEEVETQVKVQQLVADESTELDPSDKEVQERYDELIEEFGEMEIDEEQIPEFDEIEDQLKEDVKQIKEQEILDQLIEELREKAEVTIYL